VDTGAPLRGLAAHALVQMDARDAIAEITPLLMDREPLVRAEAANALGRSSFDGAAAVLHLKILAGDAELDVLQNAYAGLLRLDPRRYLPVAKAALAKADGAAEAAALALGESRRPEAFTLLKDALPGAGTGRFAQSLLMAISLLRSDGAIDLLLAQLESAPEAIATAALAALALHRHDTKIAARARDLVETRGSPSLAAALRAHLGG
jgi:HEAT repeat protein